MRWRPAGTATSDQHAMALSHLASSRSCCRAPVCLQLLHTGSSLGRQGQLNLRLVGANPLQLEARAAFLLRLGLLLLAEHLPLLREDTRAAADAKVLL